MRFIFPLPDGEEDEEKDKRREETKTFRKICHIQQENKSDRGGGVQRLLRGQ